MSFWWLNPLMTKGRKNIVEDKDIPKLREEDRAGACYKLFMDRHEKIVNPSSSASSRRPSILRTLILCHWKDIFITGFFALLKIINLSAGPLFLEAFVKVAEGKPSFKNEGYILAISLFFSKILESLSQRQWFFKGRIIGLKVRSLLSASIFKKQLRLSSASKKMHSAGEIVNYISVDANRIGEFPFWFHLTWTTGLQLCLAVLILFHAVGLAAFASLAVIILTFLCGTPLARVQLKLQPKLMAAQAAMIKAISEALVSMKVLKLYTWEARFREVIENLRAVELEWLMKVQLRRVYNIFLFWACPVLFSTAAFGTCYALGIPLHASNVFTFVATVRLVQDPIRSLPEVIGAAIQAKASFARVSKFLEAPELESATSARQKWKNTDYNVFVKSAYLSWDDNLLDPTLRNIDLKVKVGEKVAICGEVGSGKSSLLAAILGELSADIEGVIEVYGDVAYVSQSAWIQTGTIRENILFGSTLDNERYQETLDKCSLTKDLELLPRGDLTEIGERGVNLSGGQKQRIQLARALYRNADIYLLDDPFSAVDAQTATSLFNEYIMGALAGKTVLLVTHQVDFLPAFDYVLLMAGGEILHAAPYHQLLASSQEFQDLVDAHKETAGSKNTADVTPTRKGKTLKGAMSKTSINEETTITSEGDQLIKEEEKELGDIGFKPYMQYLNQNKGYFVFSLIIISQLSFVTGQILQNSWMAANVDNHNVSMLKLIMVYFVIGFISILFLLIRSFGTVVLGMQSSKSMFLQLLRSLFGAPMSFYDSTPLGRILSRVSISIMVYGYSTNNSRETHLWDINVSSDLSIVDLDIPFTLISAVTSTIIAYSSIGVLAVVTWQILFVAIPMVFLAICLQVNLHL
ncbi:hypothetical protein LguiB_032563 [Lonicera macranthoides]